MCTLYHHHIQFTGWYGLKMGHYDLDHLLLDAPISVTLMFPGCQLI